MFTSRFVLNHPQLPATTNPPNFQSWLIHLKHQLHAWFQFLHWCCLCSQCHDQLLFISSKRMAFRAKQTSQLCVQLTKTFWPSPLPYAVSEGVKLELPALHSICERIQTCSSCASISLQGSPFAAAPTITFSLHPVHMHDIAAKQWNERHVHLYFLQRSEQLCKLNMQDIHGMGSNIRGCKQFHDWFDALFGRG